MTNTVGSQPEIKQLRWRCRRGMRELDVVCERFLDRDYASASQQMKDTFHELLDTEDPIIYAWLLGREEPTSEEMKALVRTLSRA